MERRLTRRSLLGIGLGSAAVVATGCSAADGTTAATSSTTSPAASAAAETTTAADPSTTPTWAPGSPARAIVRGSGSRPQVALTFHGTGPLAITRRVTDILADHGAHATVFAIGRWLASEPDAARIILDGGHELGNHTWSHPPLSTYGPDAMYEEIVRCRDEIHRLTGGPGAFFRQSDGQYATDEECVQAGRAGYARILNYDIDSTDWKGTSTGTIRAAVARATAGSVISLHLGRSSTVAALPLVLDDLARRGLTGVTGTELLR
ncbi:polysaccharide deacetylase family protein [Tomitella fengzijianii]|uniref:Polysaccharide deacetylase family protein n=1 Tax=Tomitella fengzijianii TaxID=2597660 RepID=A0A516X792_9ACTN|nr:polysaccharide deacetylase family protein [Tomitella fengzijianii]